MEATAARPLVGQPRIALLGAYIPKSHRSETDAHKEVANGRSFFFSSRDVTLMRIFLTGATGFVGGRLLRALGAVEEAEHQYRSSKGAADARLARLGVPYVVVRPSLIYGPGDQSMTFFLSLAALPVTPVPGDGQYRVQPIHVDDLARALVA